MHCACVFIYICIYKCVCVCVCVLQMFSRNMASVILVKVGSSNSCFSGEIKLLLDWGLTIGNRNFETKIRWHLDRYTKNPHENYYFFCKTWASLFESQCVNIPQLGQYLSYMTLSYHFKTVRFGFIRDVLFLSCQSRDLLIHYWRKKFPDHKCCPRSFNWIWLSFLIALKY